jgi:hypothetical protein
MSRKRRYSAWLTRTPLNDVGRNRHSRSSHLGSQPIDLFLGKPSGCPIDQDRHFVGQFTRSELGMVSHGAFLQSNRLQSIYLVVTENVR